MDTAGLLVTGATGLVGSALGRRRAIVPLPREDPGGSAPWWQPTEGVVHDQGQRFAAVVHLAGAGVADQRWTDQRKALIRDSRVVGSRTLVQWMAGLPEDARPRTLVAASAIGVYGDRGEQELTEDSEPGAGFLAETCQAWEHELRAAEDLGVRVVRIRIGIVLSPQGGALARMLPAFRLGVGGPMGGGRQWFPWVHLDDLVAVFEHALDHDDVRGVLNATAPGIVRQGAFAEALGRALHRPAVVPAPAFALRLAMGAQLADEALLASSRVLPAALLADPRFAFRYGQLDAALADLVG